MRLRIFLPLLALAFAGALFADTPPVPVQPPVDVSAITKERDDLKKQLSDNQAGAQAYIQAVIGQRDEQAKKFLDQEAELRVTRAQFAAMTKERDELKAKVAELEKPKEPAKPEAKK